MELFENGQNDKARKIIREKGNKKNMWEYINLSKKYNSYDTAAYLIKKVLINNPNNDWLRFTLGNIYLTQDKFNEALKVFTYILGNNPNNTYVRFRLASLYLHQNRYAEAEFLLKDSIEVHGESLRANQLLFLCYALQGDEVEANKFEKKSYYMKT